MKGASLPASARQAAVPRRSRGAANPADLVLRTRASDEVRFPHLTERRALKLASIAHYTSRTHFAAWHRHLGSGPDFDRLTGVFTPLYAVDFETFDVPLDPLARVQIRGRTFLAKVVDPSGAVTHLVRQGDHSVLQKQGAGAPVVVARGQLMNVFTRYDPDPAKRRVTTLPARLGLGELPSRVVERPEIGDLAPLHRVPDFVETDSRVWHYGQTDPNRHITAMEYLRAMESYANEILWRQGHDLRRLYAARARIIYRKPCFRGEGYRRVAWVQSGDPLVVSGAFHKSEDGAGARPAVVVEITLRAHEDAG